MVRAAGPLPRGHARPPSRGSSLARRLLPWWPFRSILGRSAVQIGRRGPEAPPPPCEFGIVAAGRGDGRGWNPLLEGDDDGVVSVEETRLPGAREVLFVRGYHTTVMRHPEVTASVIRFLETGAFAA